MITQIKLRLMTDADTENIVRWRNCDRVRKNFIYQKPLSIEEHKNWIETMINTKKAVQFIICSDMEQKEMGSVYFRDIDFKHHKAEYGIFLDEEFIGKGVGTKVAKLAIQYGFETMKLHKITLRVFADNIGAIRSYEKAGFVQEAYLKEEVFVNGEYKDIILMGIIDII